MGRVRYHPCPVCASLPRRDAVVGEIEGLHTRVCRGPDCERRFEPKNTRHRHCSDRCRDRAYRRRERKRQMGFAREKAMEELFDEGWLEETLAEYDRLKDEGDL